MRSPPKTRIINAPHKHAKEAHRIRNQATQSSNAIKQRNQASNSNKQLKQATQSRNANVATDVVITKDVAKDTRQRSRVVNVVREEEHERRKAETKVAASKDPGQFPLQGGA